MVKRAKTINLAVVRGTTIEREELKEQARLAGLALNAFIRRQLGLAALPRGTPKRKDKRSAQ